jgi:hypothetical protein
MTFGPGQYPMLAGAFHLRLAHRLHRLALVTTGSAFPPRSFTQGGSDSGGFGRLFYRVITSASLAASPCDDSGDDNGDGRPSRRGAVSSCAAFPFSPRTFLHPLQRQGWRGQVKRQSLVQQQICSRAFSLASRNNETKHLPQMK